MYFLISPIYWVDSVTSVYQEFLIIVESFHFMHLFRVLARKKKILRFVWIGKYNKTQMWSGGTVSLFSPFSGEQMATFFGKFTIFNLILLWYILLEVIELKLSIVLFLIKYCHYNLKYTQLCLLFSLIRSRTKLCKIITIFYVLVVLIFYYDCII